MEKDLAERTKEVVPKTMDCWELIVDLKVEDSRWDISALQRLIHRERELNGEKKHRAVLAELGVSIQSL